MSISEIAMLVNDNFNKPLNVQMRELSYVGAYLFENSTTFTPDNSGWYKIIVVGAGGDGDVDYGTANNYYGASGGSGGVAIKTMHLLKEQSYQVEVSNSQSSFDGTIVATAGTDGYASVSTRRPGDRGIAIGGDFNYNGQDGATDINATAEPRNVSVYIPGLMEKTQKIYTSDIYGATYTGYGILAHGASGGSDRYTEVSGQPGCVLIIPLEIE